MSLLKEKEPVEIKEKKLILSEGTDAYFFCIWAYQGFGATGIQVLNFGGVTELTKYLLTLVLLPRYEIVDTMVIVRDAEKDPEAAANSVKTSLKDAALPMPDRPYEFTGSGPKVAYIIFPGFGDKEGEGLSAGTLEDLCLEIVKDDAIFECVGDYIDCMAKKNEKPANLHKAKLHAYLAGKPDFVGLKIGEAARAGAWDWSHPKLKQFRQVILEM